VSKECIHGVPLDWNCNACSDECHPKRIMPEESYTLQQAREIVIKEIMKREDMDIMRWNSPEKSHSRLGNWQLMNRDEVLEKLGEK